MQLIGSLKEQIHSLDSYGIPTKILPVTVDGFVHLQNHTLWLEHRRTVEMFRRPSENNDARLDSSFPDADFIFAEQLKRMSPEDREVLQFDIHGIRETMVEETPELLARSLEEFDSKLSKYRGKDAYQMAEAQNSRYVSDRNFRLKFLRCTKFDASWALDKFVKFFEIKLECFGPDKLTKEITLEDLDDSDIKCLESGICTLLPLRDRAGRAIICWTVKFNSDSFSLKNKVGLMWISDY